MKHNETQKKNAEQKILLAVLFTLAFVYSIDYLSHESLRFYVFYFPVLMIAAWCLGIRKVVLALLISWALWFNEYLKEESNHLWAITAWNSAVTFLTFFFVVMMSILLKQKQRTVQMMARKDPLTGAWNRRVFEEKLKEEWLRSKRYGHPLSLIYFDLNHFKGVNDVLGHAAGDTALKETVFFAQSVLRETDFLVRAGGDEFCVLLPETDQSGAESCGQKLSAILRTRLPHGLSASVGGAVFSSMPESISEIIETADQVMYEAKTRGAEFLLRKCGNDLLGKAK